MRTGAVIIWLVFFCHGGGLTDLGGSTIGTGQASIIGSFPGYEELAPGKDHSVGIQSTASGGNSNIAAGRWSPGSRGHGNAVTGDYDWRMGSNFQDQ